MTFKIYSFPISVRVITSLAIICLICTVGYITNIRQSTGVVKIDHDIYQPADDTTNDILRFGSSARADRIGLSIQTGVCSKGSVPWSTLWIVSELRRFIEVYNRRLDENRLGSPLMHQFALWCIVRHLKPKHIIESGVLRGLGTWLLRQAAPEAQLILLDPGKKLDLVYRDEAPDTRYFIGNNFRDFSSVAQWTDVTIDFNATLAFIDDHHTPLMRVPHARRVGIRHMIFEDNYWLGFHDCFSLKQACACVMGWKECSSFQYKDAFGAQTRDLTISDLRKAESIFEQINIYYEFPMIWNVWSKHTTLVSNISTNYLFDTLDGVKLLQDLGLNKLPPSSHVDGRYAYANIAYVKLHY